MAKKGTENPNYKHGLYCTISKCSCNEPKDFRAKYCAKCAKRSYPANGAHDRMHPNKSDVERVIAKAQSTKEAAEMLCVSRATMTKCIKRFSINISHFKPRLGHPGTSKRYLIKGNVYRNASVYRVLIRENLKKELCENCKTSASWNGKKLKLCLHHKNGNAKDNRLINLQILCPNCHSQTKNYCGGKNRGVSYLERQNKLC